MGHHLEEREVRAQPAVLGNSVPSPIPGRPPFKTTLPFGRVIQSQRIPGSSSNLDKNALIDEF